MSWFKRHFGLDFVDVAIQGTLTGLLMGFVSSVFFRGPDGDGAMMLVAGASVVVFGVRRYRALSRMGPDVGLTTGQMAAARIEELEARVAQLEEGEGRMVELEERLDFAERLIAQATGERAGLPAGEKR